MLTLHQPRLQQYQHWIFQHHLPRQCFQGVLQQWQLALIKQRPGVLQQHVPQHSGVARGECMMNRLAGKTLRHPALCRSPM